MPMPRWVPITQAIAISGPFALFGGLGPGEHLAPWLAAASGWATWLILVRYGIGRGWWLLPEEVVPDEGDAPSAYLRLLVLTSPYTREAVQRAFREGAKRHHPDTGGDAAKFRALVEAKEHALEELGT